MLIELHTQVSDSERNGLQLVIYDDQEFSWPQIYGKNLTCAQRLEKAKKIMYTTPLSYSNSLVLLLGTLTEISQHLLSISMNMSDLDSGILYWLRESANHCQ